MAHPGFVRLGDLSTAFDVVSEVLETGRGCVIRPVLRLGVAGDAALPFAGARRRLRAAGGRRGQACTPRGSSGLSTGLAHSSDAPRQRPSPSPLLLPATLN